MGRTWLRQLSQANEVLIVDRIMQAARTAQHEESRKGRGAKRKLSVRERLAKKLLSGRSMERAQEEAGAVENERVRDREANNF